MKKVIVFGGSGFLGSYVCDELTNVGTSKIGIPMQIPKITPIIFIILLIKVLFLT
jgi:nucleoside-diphosphate-sugar epimerase